MRPRPRASPSTSNDISKNTGEARGDRYSSIEEVVGSSFKDKLIGNSAANGFAGGDGNDVLKGGAGGDGLSGQAGDDVLKGGAGGDSPVRRHRQGPDDRQRRQPTPSCSPRRSSPTTST